MPFSIIRFGAIAHRDVSRRKPGRTSYYRDGSSHVALGKVSVLLQFSLDEFRKPTAALCERDCYPPVPLRGLLRSPRSLRASAPCPRRMSVCCASLRIWASFYDIGSIGIPDRILFNGASFDRDEWVLVKQYAVIGERIICAIDAKGGPRDCNRGAPAS